MHPIKENTKSLLIIVLTIIFLLVFFPYFLVPRHPDDDYWFFSVGLSLQNHIDLYFTISGRVIVDYISSTILQIDNRVLMVIITSLVIPIFVYVIATIPYYKQAIHYRQLALSIYILFITFWVTNPALGDTFFWIVGEVNYIWPLLVFAIYIKYLLRFINTAISNKQCIILCVLAFLGGLSNEATSLMVIYLTTCFILLSFIKKYPNTKLLLLCLLSATIGSSILILAPGNFVRAMRAGIAHYDIWQKLCGSFADVMPRIIQSYGVIYLIILLLLSYCWRTIKKKEWWVIGILTSSFFVSLIVLSISPGSDKPRTYITGIFFLWIILSFLLKIFLQSQPIITKSQKVFLVIYIIFFCVSYYYLITAYSYLHKQEKLRIAIINKEKLEHVIHIPSYVSPFTLRAGDLPCLFNALRAEGFMARYFKVPRIILDDIDFNYIALFEKQHSYKNYQVSTANKQYIKDIFLQQTSLQTKVIIEFTETIKPIKNHQSAYLIMLTISGKPNDLYSFNKPLAIYKIKNRLFTSIDITNMLLADEKYQRQISIKIVNKNKEEDNNPINILINNYQL